jgi:tetratricopeptide (TPR) repeat protein
VARLRREARAAARIDQAGIVRIYELGHVDQQYYIAMQYVSGGSLAEAKLDRRQAVAAIRDVARALEYAHAAGIVHRDIKPENILLDALGKPWLTDFGIARDLSSRGMGTEGIVVGTPELMAPEQALGRASRIDARTDIYALGATLYRLLTGRGPFNKPNLIDTLYAVVHEAPILPRSLDATIPSPLQAIMLRCLCKDPRERFQSASALADELDAWLHGEATAQESAGVSEGKRYLKFRVPGVNEADPIMALEVSAVLSTWDVDHYRGGRASGRPNLEELAERLETQIDHQPDAAWPHFYLGMTLARLDRLAPALEEMERSIDRLGPLGAAHLELGRLYLRLALAEGTLPGRRLAYVSDEDHRMVVDAYLEQASTAFAEGKRLGAHVPGWLEPTCEATGALARDDVDRCLELCERILRHDPAAERVWKLQGDALRRQRLKSPDAGAAYLRAVSIRPGYHEAWTALAALRLGQDDLEGARRAVEEAVLASPRSVPALVLGAVVELRLAESEESAQALELVQHARRGDPLDPELAEAYPSPSGRGRFAEAVWLDQALQSLEDVSGDPPVTRARGLLRAAKRALLSGGDPRADLDVILPQLLQPMVATPTKAQRAWSQLVSEAFRKR